MTELNELSERMDSNEEIIDNLIKKTTELEKQVVKMPEVNIPDYSATLNTIIKELADIKRDNKSDQLSLLNAINRKLDRLPKSATSEFRFLFFPETNQGQYYKIVFGRLIPWGLCLVAITYLYSLGGKAIDAYGQHKQSQQSAHYQRAWIYLKQIAKRRTLSAMDTAYSKTETK